ncbi:MAG: hypothetical protein GY828_01590, partial [Candidatus Gracilibacteria bacterium]|nr:hypothetical protein [Candidatus Gracilibacteria bacterium]
SLSTISEKYKFVLENYLSDEFQNTKNTFHLPKNRKQYEIAYLGAHGDAQNMYVQMNPERKEESPYSDILKVNAELQAKLLGENISGISGTTDLNSNNGISSDSNDGGDQNEENTENGKGNDEGEEEQQSAVFNCAPPEGVPIYEWMPAIVCWLDDMLPPKITVNESSCGPTLDLLHDEEKDYIKQCNGDTDKNSINDCVEKNLEGGSLQLHSDSQKYNFDSSGKISVSVLDSENNGVGLDNSSEVQFTLVKIEVAEDETKNITSNVIGSSVHVHKEKGSRQARQFIKNLNIYEFLIFF